MICCRLSDAATRYVVGLVFAGLCDREGGVLVLDFPRDMRQTLSIACFVQVVHPNKNILPLASFAGPQHSTEVVVGLMPILVHGWNFKKIYAHSSPLSSMLYFVL